ncbi:peptidoglycan-binding domain-containing protein [Roseateles sp. DB2]|uniref:peptidoglycan-binding domain-containing protein n=1 Tax=Roseateles sp. DB2 TaxID=3453717 RepID=UPI003EEB503D
MGLQAIANGTTAAIATSAIGGDHPLATEVQQRLIAAGLIEPPADGDFGPVSQWALDEFLRKIGSPGKGQLDAAMAQALLDPSVGALFPIKPTTTLAGRIAGALLSKRWWITRHPDCVNIVYIEGLNPDGTPNADEANVFNDLRVVLRINTSGEPEIAGAWEGTTGPGYYYVKLQKLDPQGAARIALGQFKSWSVGMHPRGTPAIAHEALVQVKEITVYRDLNEDFRREDDRQFTGLFGINQHSGYNRPVDDIGNASAGCLVGRTKSGHQAFMALVKADPRYLANRGFRFMTTVITAADLG